MDSKKNELIKKSLLNMSTKNNKNNFMIEGEYDHKSLLNMSMKNNKSNSVIKSKFDPIRQSELRGEYDRCADYKNDMIFEKLNKKFLEELEYRMNKNKHYNFLDVLEEYELCVKKMFICVCKKDTLSILKNNGTLNRQKDKYKNIKLDVEYFSGIKNIFLNKKKNDDLENTLEALLNNEIEDIHVQNTEFKFIKLEDIFKSKGNCINGPRREDIGKYNIKLFEMLCKNNKKNKEFKIIINPCFFKELSDIVNKYKIIQCEHINFYYFKNCMKYQIEDCIIAFYIKKNKISCTIRNTEIILFDFTDYDLFKAHLSKNSKEILFFYFENFTLYSIKFLSSEIANDVYELFFSKK